MWLILTFTVFNSSFSSVAVTTAQVEYRSAQECAFHAAMFDGAGTPIAMRFASTPSGAAVFASPSDGETPVFVPPGVSDPQIVGWRTTSAICAGTGLLVSVPVKPQMKQ